MALALDRATFGQVLGGNPEVGQRMLEQLIRRLRDAEDQIEILMVRDQHSKVVIALTKLAQQAAAAEGRPNGQVVLRVSPLELSAHVGLDVDTVKRIVMQLREAGYLRIQDERVELIDLDHLRELYSLLGVKEQLRGTHERERERGRPSMMLSRFWSLSALLVTLGCGAANSGAPGRKTPSDSPKPNTTSLETSGSGRSRIAKRSTTRSRPSISTKRTPKRTTSSLSSIWTFAAAGPPIAA